MRPQGKYLCFLLLLVVSAFWASGCVYHQSAASRPPSHRGPLTEQEARLIALEYCRGQGYAGMEVLGAQLVDARRWQVSLRDGNARSMVMARVWIAADDGRVLDSEFEHHSSGPGRPGRGHAPDDEHRADPAYRDHPPASSDGDTRRGRPAARPVDRAAPGTRIPPGEEGESPRRGRRGRAPGGSPAEASPPGHSASPAHGGTPPGQGGTPPGHSVSPARGGTPPGHADGHPGRGRGRRGEEAQEEEEGRRPASPGAPLERPVRRAPAPDEAGRGEERPDVRQPVPERPSTHRPRDPNPSDRASSDDREEASESPAVSPGRPDSPPAAGRSRAEQRGRSAAGARGRGPSVDDEEEDEDDEESRGRRRVAPARGRAPAR